MDDRGVEQAEERSFLQTVICSPDKLDIIFQLADTLKPEHFYKKAHGEMWRCILSLVAYNKPVDMLTVSRAIRDLNMPGIVDVDDVTALGLEDIMPLVPANAIQRAEEIMATWQVSAMRTAGAEMSRVETMDDIHKCYLKAGKILDQSSDKPFSSTKIDAKKVLVEIESISAGVRDVGLATGFHFLDDLTGGFGGGDLVVFGAMSSTGKTTFALDIAWNIAKKVPVGFFSIEMTRNPIYFKLFSRASGVSAQKMRRGTLSEGEMAQLRDAEKVIASQSLFFDFFGLELNQIILRARRLHAQEKISMLVVDYCQMIQSLEGETRERQVSIIPEKLKRLARDLDIPVILLAQLNRKSMDIQGHEPEMWHLRESGGLEQAADFVLLVWRDFAGNKNTHFKLAKNRPLGQCGKWDLLWDDVHMRYKNLPEHFQYAPIERPEMPKKHPQEPGEALRGTADVEPIL